MKNLMRIQLNTTPEQDQRLLALQVAVAEVCNALVPLVRERRCWNRVALHHIAYHAMRQRFPSLGSQMVCNAIYAVSRACRIILQAPNSPWVLGRGSEQQVPELRFLATSPVFFDRHTLSIKRGRFSMYTLDGRMKFEASLTEEDEARFSDEKLREVALSRGAGGYELSVTFAGPADERNTVDDLPQYVLVLPVADGPESAGYLPGAMRASDPTPTMEHR